eukprot:22021-Pleurochrysis_carterae.AAC.4
MQGWRSWLAAIRRERRRRVGARGVDLRNRTPTRTGRAEAPPPPPAEQGRARVRGRGAALARADGRAAGWGRGATCDASGLRPPAPSASTVGLHRVHATHRPSGERERGIASAQPTQTAHSSPRWRRRGWVPAVPTPSASTPTREPTAYVPQSRVGSDQGSELANGGDQANAHDQGVAAPPLRE